MHAHAQNTTHTHVVTHQRRRPQAHESIGDFAIENAEQKFRWSRHHHPFGFATNCSHFSQRPQHLLVRSGADDDTTQTQSSLVTPPNANPKVRALRDNVCEMTDGWVSGGVCGAQRQQRQKQNRCGQPIDSEWNPGRASGSVEDHLCARARASAGDVVYNTRSL